MTTARWRILCPVTLAVAGLVPTQPIEADLWPEPRPGPMWSGDPLVHVVHVGGVDYLEDGHHRWARARARGERFIGGRRLVIPATTVTPPIRRGMARHGPTPPPDMG